MCGEGTHCSSTPRLQYPRFSHTSALGHWPACSCIRLMRWCPQQSGLIRCVYWVSLKKVNWNEKKKESIITLHTIGDNNEQRRGYLGMSGTSFVTLGITMNGTEHQKTRIKWKNNSAPWRPLSSVNRQRQVVQKGAKGSFKMQHNYFTFLSYMLSPWHTIQTHKDIWIF